MGFTHNSLYLILLILLITTRLSTQTESPADIATRRQICQLQGYELNVTIHGCKATTLQMSTCLGACISLHSPHVGHVEGESLTLKEITTCCKVTEAAEVTLALDCVKEGVMYKHHHKVKSASACGCKRCGF
ncbi:uncharacterized protein LOC130642136 [Hydractinia symbiolongicarpus]|uniref:uncharacterized protein LOC130642136 n=1 Tax=Hydractinia symbiolongicarpus TaxID=13093 RepID=UPI00254FA169|nr:uncharacterized protein LOC130642136 [Hydractinia symbiolongicarpus]